MSQATLHQNAEQEVADAEQELANWQTAKNSQTIAALDLPSLPQRLSLNHGLVVDSERIVSALDLAGVDEARRMLTKSGSSLPDASIATSCIAVISTAIAKHNYYVRALLRPEGVWELVDAGRGADAPLPLQPLDHLTPPPPLPNELRDAGWSIRQSATTRLWYYHQEGVNGAWRIQKERPWCPDKWPLRRAQPCDRDPFRALPADVVGRVLENFNLDPWVRDALGHAALDRNGRREWKNDAALADLLAFGLCSKATRRAATTDALWRERMALLERTHVLTSESADAGLWRPPSLDAYVDPRIFNPKAYAAATCFRRYKSLAELRNNVRWKLQRLRNEKHWTTQDRAKLAEVADLAREALEGNQAEEAEDATLPKHDLTTCTRHSYEDCFKFCEIHNVARTIVQYAMRQLDGGADGHVRTLIVRGFADVNVTGLISQESDHDPEDEWDADDNVAFAVSGCGSLNPFRFEFDEWEPEEEPEAAA